LNFGRAGDLPVDSNQFMHRLVGRVVSREGVWWLQNLGTRIRPALVRAASSASDHRAAGS
jgi:hypothetical protein